ncbi:MAG TPA: hypothetical protein VJ302_10450 [Blastocatellia bacterium]|nr:hypothetical protein [Blastocatellia bacterium]
MTDKTKITVTFVNLCALFTKKLNAELMVGLLDLSDFYGDPAPESHAPKITIETHKKIINPNQEEVLVPQRWAYEGFQPIHSDHSHDEGEHAMPVPAVESRHLCGDIRLDVYGVKPGLNLKLADENQISDLTRRETARRIKANLLPEGEGGISIDSFDKVVDIQAQLYRGKSLKVNPWLCKTRFYFHHGTLFSVFRVSQGPVVFTPPNPNDVNKPYPIETGLELVLPENGYAVLRFLNSDVKDFVFEGGQGTNYSVVIENSPSNHQPGDDPNHFKFYYNLVEPSSLPKERYLPSLGLTQLGDPFCMNARYSSY